MNSILENTEYPNCRRNAPDPRQTTMRTVLSSMYRRRRRHERRSGVGNDNTYVDVHGPGVVVATIAVMLLCVCDAFFTLMLIERGSSELNPLLAWMLQIDTFWFYTVKYSLTSVCILWVVMHKHFNFFGFKGKHVLMATLFGYLALITYQVSMLTRII